MRLTFKLIFHTIFFLGLCLPTLTARAVDGAPGSPRFGYGVQIDVHNTNLAFAIQTAGEMGVDWIAVDFDWASHCPLPGKPCQFDSLDNLMSLAKDQDLAVLLSITQPPPWAMAKGSPDPDLTAELATNLVNRYRFTLFALELFPGANTVSGWGAQPNPGRYTSLATRVHHVLQQVGPEIILVAGGLKVEVQSNEDIDDLTFLKGIYESGGAACFPVIGLRMEDIGTSPISLPGDPDTIALRHYENVREIMLQNNHQNGLIWITRFSWNSNSVSSPLEQADWLQQSYNLMRSQLYIGTAIIKDLNPFSSSGTQNMGGNSTNPHPAIEVLRQIIAMDNAQPGDSSVPQGLFNAGRLKKSPNQLVKRP